MRVGLERKIRISIEMSPSDAAMFGRPIAVDILRRDMVHAKFLDGRRCRFRTKCCHTQARNIVSFDISKIRGISHHRFQKGHARLEDCDTMALYHRRKSSSMREYGRTFRDYACNAGKQCGRNQIALSRNPAGVSYDIHDIARPRIKRHLHRMGDAGGISTMHVDNTFWLPRRSRGVDKKHRIFGIDR